MTTRRWYQDSTLEWAKANPEVAQRCLQPPSWDEFDGKFSEDCVSSLEQYCEWRGWELPQAGVDPSLDHHNGHLPINLVSHVLSAPLTLALFYRAFYTNHMNPSEQLEASPWCCLGARAEATLPTDFWKEFLLLSSRSTGNSEIHLDMDFVGPDVHSAMKDKTIHWKANCDLNLSWKYRGLLHDLFEGPDLKWKAYVLLNPGVGHNHLLKEWQPTLEMLLKDQVHPFTLFFTAHSELDARRDAKLFQEEYGLKVNYQLNPFASRITYKDPFAQDHFVRPNHYYAVVEVL